jgi:hypothetical protein
MYDVMNKCLACLNNRAQETKDTASINNLILYYTEGIGTQVNDSTANYWREQLEAITHPDIGYSGKGRDGRTGKKKSSVNVFVGYSANLLAPVGLTAGVTGKKFGGYVRYRTNLSSQKYSESCDKTGKVEGMEGYSWLGNKKTNTTMITGGFVFKPMQQFLVSIGGGYWKSDLMYEFEKTNLTVTAPEGRFWAKSDDLSYKGLVIDLDGTYRIGKVFYVSAGCSFMNFKLAYGNAGVGVFF